MRSDHELLLGLLALQCGFITKDQLVAAFSIWTSDKSRSLASILIENKAVSESQQSLLSALVVEHLKQHDNDPEKSLASIGSLPSIKSDLENLADSDLHASLIHVPAAAQHSSSAANDPFATQTLEGRAISASRFRILRPHAMGGLGQVSVALDKELHREVAFKEIKSQFADHEESRQRFVREAEITGALEHPSIVPVYGLGTYGDGRPYYAMRFIKGDSLKDWITQFHKKKAQMPSGEKTLALRQLLSRFIDVCQAMHYAHSRGVLHRDLKPHNVMLGKYGETLVVDWGLAKTLGEKSKEFRSEDTALVTPNLSGSSDFTIQGSAIGTPAYMSPEQAEGKIDELGPASDIYSLGVTLYHCLTGRVPFEQKTKEEVLEAVRKGEYPRPRELDRSISKALESICLKAMQRKATDRYRTAQALADDIEHLLAEEPVTAHAESVTERAARFGRKHKTATQTAIIGLALLSALLATSTWIVTRQREAAKKLAESNKSLANEKSKLAQEKSTLADERGKLLAKSIEQANALQLESAKVAFRFGLSEYSQGRLSVAYRELFRAWLLAAPDPQIRNSYETILTDRMEQGRSGEKNFRNLHLFTKQDFSPDGDLLFGTSDYAELVAVDPRSGRAKPTVVTADTDLIAFSNDGKKFVTLHSDTESTGIFIKTTRQLDSLQIWDTSNLKPIGEKLPHKSKVLSITFSVDNQEMVVVSDDGQLRFWSLETGQTARETRRLASSLKMAAFSPEGTILAISPNQSALRVVNWQDPARSTFEPQLEGKIVSVTFSPNGKMMLVWTEQDLRLFECESGKSIGKPISQVMFEPKFSPDSQRFLTASHNAVQLRNSADGEEIGDSGKMEFAWPTTIEFSPANDTYLVLTETGPAIYSAENAAAIGQPIAHGSFVYAVAYSPDGRYIATGGNDNAVRVWSVDSGEQIGNPILHDENFDDITFSPDGVLLATSSNSGCRISNFHPLSAVLAEFRHDAYLNALSIDPTGRLVATAAADNTARLWNVSTGRPVGEIMAHRDVVKSVCFASSGDRLATASAGGVVRLWDATNAAPVGLEMKHQGEVKCLAFSPDGRFIATAAEKEKSIRFWDGKTGQPTSTRLDHGADVDYFTFSPDGRYLATSAKDIKRRVWDLSAGKLAWPEIEGSLSRLDEVKDIGFMPPRDQVAIAANNGSILLADARTGKPISSLSLADGEYCQTATVSTTCKYIMTLGGGEPAIYLWNSITRKPVGEAIRFPSLHRYAFSPNDNFLATSSINGAVQQWDPLTTQPVGSMWRHPDRIECVAYSPDNRFLATASDDCTARLWSTEPSPKPKEIQPWFELGVGMKLGADGEMIKLAAEEQIARSNLLDQDHQWQDKTKQYAESVGERTHRRAAEAGEYDHHWYSAAFHLKQLTKRYPNDPSLAIRLQVAEKRLPHWRLDFEARRAEKLGNWKEAKEKLAILVASSPEDTTFAKRHESAMQQEQNPTPRIERPKPQMGGGFF